MTIVRVLAIIGMAACSSAASVNASDLPIPVIFAPGTISAGGNDGAPTFSPDGRTLYFGRSNSRWSAILEARFVHGRWTTPVLVPFAADFDQQPALAPDGTYMIYASPRTVGGDGGAIRRVAHLFRVERAANNWGEPTELPPAVNFSSRVFKPSIANNGDIYFMAGNDSGPPKWRLYRARREGSGYAKATPLAFSGPDDGDVDPFIAPDQSYLIFSSNTRSKPNDGHEHLFIVRREGQGWSPAQAIRYDGDGMGADDGEANVGPDGRLYFTSGRVLPLRSGRNWAMRKSDLARMDAWDNSNSNVWSLPAEAYR